MDKRKPRERAAFPPSSRHLRAVIGDIAAENESSLTRLLVDNSALPSGAATSTNASTHIISRLETDLSRTATAGAEVVGYIVEYKGMYRIRPASSLAVSLSSGISSRQLLKIILRRAETGANRDTGLRRVSMHI